MPYSAAKKYAGLNSIPDEELIDLKAAIDEEIESRCKKLRDEIADEIKESILTAIDAGCGVIIENEEDEIELTPEQVAHIQVTVYSPAEDSSSNLIR